MYKDKQKIESVNETKLLLRDWQFKQVDAQQWLPAKVPGCVHTDLLANNKIVDPFYGKNEIDQQWIDKMDWQYETTFDVPDNIYGLNHQQLVFRGLDTYANVYLNGEEVLNANNMFRTWKVDVRSLLKKEKNKLKIHFQSPINKNLPEIQRLGYNLPAINDDSQIGGIGDSKVSVFTRKAPYHYGWDWGPRFVTSGIWKDVELVGWSEARITDLFIHQKSVNTSLAQLEAKVAIEAENNWEGMLKLYAEGIEIKQKVRLTQGVNDVKIDLEIENPRLWWSRGLGAQNLYEFLVELSSGEEIMATKKVKTGLRSMKVVREKDEYGNSFYFELNGVPVFAKGANHIPNDSFVTEVTYERYKHEIISAVESNMNMLRVWGGGIYEYDEFYELCDEYGIMVWQDFMFACSMYPGNEEFLNNLKVEAEETVVRLRNHPSIVLWCGNNEMDVAWAAYDDNGGWGWKDVYPPELRQKIWDDYKKIFHYILPEVIGKFAPSESYWPSSPIRELTGDEYQHAQEVMGSGDIHYWDVWHGGKPFEDYNTHVGRFMSEYGFQSFPELKTVNTYSKGEDLALESEVMLHHQKNSSGNQKIEEYMEEYCPTPKDFPSFLYMSQILQAEGVKRAIEAHRTKMPYCMGTLYWQLNDCWPVASWSSMDYYGRWKALHYYAKRSYQDVMVSIVEQDKKLTVYIVSDLQKPILGTITVKLIDFNGEIVQKSIHSVTVERNTSELVLNLSREELLNDRNPNRTVLLVELEQNGEVLDSKEHYFATTKDLDYQVPNITISKVKGSNKHTYSLKSDVLAKQVRLATEAEGMFSDNYFDLIPGQPKQITFYSRNANYQPVHLVDLEISSMVDYIHIKTLID